MADNYYIFDSATINNNAPETPGVYYLIIPYLRMPEIYYVGSSCNLRQRLTQHFGDPRWKNVRLFCFVKCSSEAHARTLESNEIDRLQPKGNKQGINEDVVTELLKALANRR